MDNIINNNIINKYSGETGDSSTYNESLAAAEARVIIDSTTGKKLKSKKELKEIEREYEEKKTVIIQEQKKIDKEKKKLHKKVLGKLLDPPETPLGRIKKRKRSCHNDIAPGK